MMAKYSVILPVRNGGEYVKSCVDSILSQTLADFELLVLDNCSTDGTLQWLQSVRDARIQIYPAERSLSIEENWSRALTVPKGEFITLIGHDDLLSSDYLSTMDALIKKHPGASLYQTHFRYIDAVGNVIRRCKPMDEIQQAAEFLAFFLSGTIDANGTGFMVRSKDYDGYGGIPTKYPNLLFADFDLWIAMTGLSYKATAPQECFSFRLHQSTTTRSPDIKFQLAYGEFINFLERLKTESADFDDAIQRYVLNFIRQYCKGLTHRLLRTPKHKREGQDVASFLAKNVGYARRLVPGETFIPEEDYTVKLAKRIDQNSVARSMFLAFKKLYAKPVYK